jgi:hypothetical protein
MEYAETINCLCQNGGKFMRIELVQKGDRAGILQDGVEWGDLQYSIRMGRNVLVPEKVVMAGSNLIKASFYGAELQDEISGDGKLIRIKRQWKISAPGKWQLAFGYIPAGDLRQWIVPCVMYDENRMGAGKFPKGGIDKGWSFREDRISIPSCSILHNGFEWQAVFTSPAMEEGEVSSVKTFVSNGRPAFEIRTPYTEEPHTYTEKGIFIGGLTGKTEKLFNVRETHFEYSRMFYIMSGKCRHVSEIYTGLVDAALDEFETKEGGLQKPDWSRIASLKFRHLNYLLIDDKNITAIKMGKGNGLFQSFYEFAAGSFLVRGMEAATIFARFAAEQGDNKYRELAEKTGTFFLGGALPNGMHRDCYSLKDGRWGGYIGVGTPEKLQKGANARCNGETMVNYLRLYKILEDAGRRANQFMDVAKWNAEFYIEHQLKGEEEGSFGRWWDISGKPLNTLGTNGAYIISLLVELEKTVGKRDDIDDALEKAGKFYTGLVDRNGFYADTLDADCVDKEAGVGLLHAFLDLYERSHDGYYLKYSVLSAGFVLSWMFTYNVAFNPDSPLGKRDFQTAGMTAVSVAHHHLDFYGLSIAYDLLRLWEATNEDLWKKCALLMIDACAQLISSSEDYLGRSADFTGWQPEQINQTNWDYKLRYLGTKGRFHTCVAWVPVLTLGAMLDIRERFPDILGFRAQ